jgi:hypothetical protein
VSGIEGFYWWDAPGGSLPAARLRDDRSRNLATLITGDVRTDGASLLEALMLVEWARGGKDDIEEWEGDSTAAEFRPDGVTITDLGPDPKSERYSLDEVHQALIAYWEFLFTSPGARQGALAAWAREYEQEFPGVTDPRHPCLGHLPV